MTDLVWHRGAEPSIGDRRTSSTISKWRRGTYEEDTLAGDLVRLGGDWSILSGAHCGVPAIDFIIIGPSGVFVIDSRIMAHRNIFVDENQLLINGVPIDTVLDIRMAALSISSTLTVTTGEIVNVKPVIVVPEEASVEFGGNPDLRTTVVHADRLTRWLVDGPQALSAQAVSYFTMVAEERDTWGASSGSAA